MNKSKTIFMLVLVAFVLILIALVFFEYREPDEQKSVSFSNTKQINHQKPESDALPLRIALGSMTTPKSGYAYYQKLSEYIGKKLNRPVKIIDKRTYGEVNELLKRNEVDVAFVCGRPYVDGHDQFHLELLVAPQINGKITYHSYIIVHKNSKLQSFKDLRGKVFAFTDPLSNSGKLAPTYMLMQMGETPDTYFKDYYYTHAHDNSIKAVAQKLADGAAVDSLIWDYEMKFHPQYAQDTKIIDRSEPYGIPPVVVPRDLPEETKQKLRQILLTIHKTKEGKAILEGMGIDKFVLVTDRNYDSIRKMREYVGSK